MGGHCLKWILSRILHFLHFSLKVVLAKSSKSMHNVEIIRDVWEHNLEEEMDNIRDLVDRYPYVAMVLSFFDSGLIDDLLRFFRIPSSLEWYHALSGPSRVLLITTIR